MIEASELEVKHITFASWSQDRLWSRVQLISATRTQGPTRIDPSQDKRALEHWYKKKRHQAPNADAASRQNNPTVTEKRARQQTLEMT